MDIDQAIRERRSVRKFLPDPIGDAELEAVIEAGVWAPSACNIQGWRFIILSKPRVTGIVLEGGSSIMLDAPANILVCYRNTTRNMEYSDHLQSAGACVQNMLLKAHSMGLGACWICQLPPRQRVREILGIPFYYDPVACVAIGKPAPIAEEIGKTVKHYSDPVARPRRHRLSDIVFHDRFVEDSKEIHKLLNILTWDNDDAEALRRVARMYAGQGRIADLFGLCEHLMGKR